MMVLKYIFMFNMMFVGGLGIILNCFESYVPAVISRMYRYGKFGITDKGLAVANLEVPKRWYRHFYTFAAPFSTFGLILMSYKYFYHGDYPDTIYSLLDRLCGDPELSIVNPENAFLGLALFAVHVWKRLYESYHVNVFSNKTMNLLHYIVAMIHYSGVVLALMGEGNASRTTFQLGRLTYLDITFVIISLSASYVQYGANVILGNLRKNDKNEVVYNGYKVPHGQLFDYVSAPLQLTEMLVYVSIAMVVRYSRTFHIIAIWVVINQLECAFLTHWWNQETFKNYPKNRKILIPYIF